jgi:hypothetical protein
MTKILNEGLDYLDLKGQITPELSVDEYKAQMGGDDEIVTCSFVVKGHQQSEDLVDWLEKGYDWILDAEVSSGEVTSGKYVVFVEMNRRTSVPERIVDMLEDLETLTGTMLEEWAVIVNGEKYHANVDELKSVLVLSPQKYRELNNMEVGEDSPEEQEVEQPESTDKELSEMRDAAGIPHKARATKPDALLRDFLAKAGL